MNTISAVARLRFVAALLSVSTALAGCKTMDAFVRADDPSLTPAEKQLQEDERKFASTVFSGVAMGVAGGAAVGALAAWASGGSKKNVRNAAIGGAVVGGTLVGVDAYVTAKKQQAGDQNLRAVQAAAADMRQDNERLRTYIANSRQVLNEGKARLASLNADIAAKKVSVEQAKAAREREERNIDSMQETLAEARKTQAQYAEASKKLGASEDERRALHRQIEDMNRQINDLERNVAEYNRALTVSRA